MGAWPLASCQEQQQSCHGQKDTREALAQAEEGWEGETGPPGRRSCQPAPSPPPRLGLGQVTPPLGKNQQSCWLEDEIPTESPHSPAGGGGCRGWRLDPQEPLGWDGGGAVFTGEPCQLEVLHRCPHAVWGMTWGHRDGTGLRAGAGRLGRRPQQLLPRTAHHVQQLLDRARGGLGQGLPRGHRPLLHGHTNTC